MKIVLKEIQMKTTVESDQVNSRFVLLLRWMEIMLAAILL